MLANITSFLPEPSVITDFYPEISKQIQWKPYMNLCIRDIWLTVTKQKYYSSASCWNNMYSFLLYESPDTKSVGRIFEEISEESYWDLTEKAKHRNFAQLCSLLSRSNPAVREFLSAWG